VLGLRERGNALFGSGGYGKVPGHEIFKPTRYNKGAIEDMRTALKMRVDMSLDKHDQTHVDVLKSTEKIRTSGLRKEICIGIWDIMANAKVRVEKHQDELCE
jgi:hypothetical protein